MTLRQDQQQQPLTRRQLREMERAAAAAAETGEQQVPAVQLPFSAQQSEQTDDAAAFRKPAEPAKPEGIAAAVPADVRPAWTTDGPLTPPQPEPPAAEAPVVPLTRRQLRALQHARDEAAQPAPISEAPAGEKPAPEASVPPPPPVIDEAPVQQKVTEGPATPPVIDSAPVQPTTGEVRAYQPPAGHWSLGATESFDDVIASGVEDAQLRAMESSGGSSTSNALIMPVVPSAADMTGPLNATGEILLTGSIDLPRSLGATGQIPNRFDGSDIDRMFDQHDTDAPSTSSVEPIAATRAISTRIPTQNTNIVPPKKTSHRVGAIVGSVAGGVAALGVAGVLVAGFVFHAF